MKHLVHIKGPTELLFMLIDWQCYMCSYSKFFTIYLKQGLHSNQFHV